MQVELLRRRPNFLPEGAVGRTPAQKAGYRHERRVHRLFEARGSGLYLPGPWLRYRSSSLLDWRFCQPDGLFFIPQEGKILLIEAKLAHTPRAYAQMHRYLQLTQALFPPWLVIPLEVVKFFGSLQDFPVPIRLRRRPEDAVEGAFNVYVLSFHD